MFPPSLLFVHKILEGDTRSTMANNETELSKNCKNNINIIRLNKDRNYI